MKLKYLFALSMGALMLNACVEMDLQPEGATLTTDIKQEVSTAMPDRAEASVRAIFSQFNVYAPNYGVFGNRVRHNDFGYSSIMMFTDANTEDWSGADDGYNWAGNSMTYDDRPYTSYESDIVWNDHYNIIFAANSVVGSIDPATTDALSQFYLAQGLASRGFAYLGLAQLYQFNYKGNEDKPCVPLITDQNADDAAVNGAKRASVQEVYNQIDADLTEAIRLLEASEAVGQTRPDRRYIDLAVSFGLRARMNLAMQNYAQAALDADSAIYYTDARPATIAEVSAPAFASAAEPNWMWGILIAETDDVVSSGIVNWISHCGTFNYGYCQYSGGHQISKKLYNVIPESDVRKGWWSNAEGKSANIPAAWQDYLDELEFPKYTSCKFAPYQNILDNDVNANDIPLMRVEEMYLIKAEAQAMSGADGKTTLENFVKTYRDPEYTSTGNVQDDVYLQKRIELWGEGLIWYDVMRLNKGIDRRGAGFPITAVLKIDADDPILLWRLPQTEIQGNSALTDDDNNKSTEVPTPVDDDETVKL